MIGYSGWGLLPVLLPTIPVIVWISISDYGRGDWATAFLVAALVALLLGAVNLGIAAVLNRDDSPQEDRIVWTGAHRSGGTALQSYTPMFLALAGAALAGWTIQWVPWPVAVGGYLAGIVAYFALAALSRRRIRAVAIANRRAFAERHGWAFRDRLPGLSTRWQSGPFTQSPAFAEMMNAPRGRLRGHFAAMSGGERYTFTVVDAFEPGQWAVFRTWQWRPVTISAVHLEGNLPNLRLTLHQTGWHEKRYEVVYDCAIPEYAEVVASEDVVRTMLAQGLAEFEIQGRDVLVVLRNLPDDQDPNEYAMSMVNGLAVVLSQVSEDVEHWVHGDLAELPMPTNIQG